MIMKAYFYLTSLTNSSWKNYMVDPWLRSRHYLRVTQTPSENNN